MYENSRYDIQNKSNRFMQFVSRQMMRRYKNRSYVQNPNQKTRNNRMFSDSRNEGPVAPSSNAVVQIYSQGQLPRHRRGTSILKSNSKSKYNESFSRSKKQSKESSLNFYQGLKYKQARSKPKQQTSPTMGLTGDQDYHFQQIHYEMVRLQQNMKKLQAGR